MKSPPHLSHRRLKLAAVLFTCILLLGALGYHYLRGLSFPDALYMTVITISTVGFAEIGTEFGPGVRFFTVGLILSSMGVVAFSATSFASSAVEGEL
jgi:voltage-gated potassium channel